MLRKSRIRKVLAGISVASVMVMVAPPARATIFTGFCVVQLDFLFDDQVGLTGSAPSYTVTLSAGPAVDFSPDAVTGWSGRQPCVISLDALEPQRETGAFGQGSSTVWTCGATLAAGTWSQDWMDSDGFFTPPSLTGQHFITGTWNDWTLTLTGPNFTGVAELTAASHQQLKPASCATGGGYFDLTMVGVLEFQDP